MFLLEKNNEIRRNNLVRFNRKNKQDDKPNKFPWGFD